MVGHRLGDPDRVQGAELVVPLKRAGPISRGQITEARNSLAPDYGYFTEGFDTADLKEAKALPDELSLPAEFLNPTGQNENRSFRRVVLHVRKGGMTNIELSTMASS